MKISTSLKNFQERDKSIDNLGSSKNDILNFWIFIDELSFDQWKVIERKFDDIRELNYVNGTPFRTPLELIANDMNPHLYDIQYSTWNCPYEKYGLSLASAIFATYELIAMEKLFDEGRSLQFLPLFINL